MANGEIHHYNGLSFKQIYTICKLLDPTWVLSFFHSTNSYCVSCTVLSCARDTNVNRSLYSHVVIKAKLWTGRKRSSKLPENEQLLELLTPLFCDEYSFCLLIFGLKTNLNISLNTNIQRLVLLGLLNIYLQNAELGWFHLYYCWSKIFYMPSGLRLYRPKTTGIDPSSSLAN